MTFENHTRGEHDHGAPKDQHDQEIKKDNNPTEKPDSTTKNAIGSIDLAGGQPKNDPGGMDMSQYTGPGSKPSSQLEDPEAPFATGPGNGITNSKKTDETDWENPEPENDSF